MKRLKMMAAVMVIGAVIGGGGCASVERREAYLQCLGDPKGYQREKVECKHWFMPAAICQCKTRGL